MRADDDTDDAPPVSPVQAVALVAELLWAGRQAGTVSATFSAGGLAALQKAARS